MFFILFTMFLISLTTGITLTVKREYMFGNIAFLVAVLLLFAMWYYYKKLKEKNKKLDCSECGYADCNCSDCLPSSRGHHQLDCDGDCSPW
ncbi:hypothetical protein SFC65_20135 [Priestia filamentosa]|uniref:hypothetical protein n=1 Tax=Priestia filamentosa TaxID=1402861 RepID=UPI003981BF68